MNPIIRYPLLFIIWFGVVFGIYLHNQPAESLEPIQPEQPKVEIRESEAQAMALKVLQGKVDALEQDINAKTAILHDLESKNEELENKLSKQGKKSNSPKAKSNTQTTERQTANSGTTTNSLSSGELARHLNEAASRTKSCGKGGYLVLQLTIANDGHVSRVLSVSGSFKGSATERCIIDRFKSHSFPRFNKPASVETTYTVRL